MDGPKYDCSLLSVSLNIHLVELRKFSTGITEGFIKYLKMKMLNRLLGTLIEYGDYMELDALNLDQGYF